MKRILCKLCVSKNPKHPGFLSQPFETMADEEIKKKILNLTNHLSSEHPEVLQQAQMAAMDMITFLALCAFDFEEPFAVASRDKLRYDLAKLTRAYKLSDEKIEEKVHAMLNAEYDYAGINAVIKLIKSIRDQLQEIGQYSQEEPAESSVLITP